MQLFLYMSLIRLSIRLLYCDCFLSVSLDLSRPTRVLLTTVVILVNICCIISIHDVHAAQLNTWLRRIVARDNGALAIFYPCMHYSTRDYITQNVHFMYKEGNELFREGQMYTLNTRLKRAEARDDVALARFYLYR